MSSPKFSIQSIQDPRQLAPALQQLALEVASLQRRVADLTIAASQPPLSLNSILAIRSALESTGVAPINVAGLVGILAQSQRGFAVVATSAAALPSPALMEVGTIGAVLSGTTLTFYLVQEGMPRSWVAQTSIALSAVDNSFTIQDDADGTKRIRFEASTIATGNTRVQTVPNTDQILAGRNVNNSFTFVQDLTHTDAARTGIQIRNNDATGTAGISVLDEGGTIRATLGYDNNLDLAKVDTTGTVTIALSVGGTTRILVTNVGFVATGTGTITDLLTLSRAGQALLLSGNAAANTKMLEIAPGGSSVFSVDREGDVIANNVLADDCEFESVLVERVAPLVQISNTGLTTDVLVIGESGSSEFVVASDGDVSTSGSMDIGGIASVLDHVVISNESSIYSGAGDPNGALSATSGDYFLRSDTPGTANQRIYVCSGGTTWTGIV